MKNIETSNIWSIRSFYRKAWDLTKRHKKLWIFGLAVVLFGSSNDYDSNSNRSESSSETEEQSIIKEVNVIYAQESDETYSLSDNQLSKFEEQILPYWEVFKQQPFELYILAGIGFVITLIIMMTIGVVINSWSHAALIAAINQADFNDNVDLYTVAQLASSKITSMIWLLFMPALRIIGVFLVVIFVLAGFYFISSIMAIWILMLPVGIYFLWKMFQLLYILIVAQRYLVLTENVTGQDAYQAGEKISLINKSKIFTLGFSNTVLVLLMALILIAIAGFTFIGLDTVFGESIYTDSTFLTAVGALFLIVFLPIYFLTMSIYKVFNFSTWHYAYLSLMQNEESR